MRPDKFKGIIVNLNLVKLSRVIASEPELGNCSIITEYRLQTNKSSATAAVGKK